MTFEEIIDFVGQRRRTSVIRIFFGDGDDFNGEHTEKDLRNFVWINYKVNHTTIEKVIAQFDEMIDAKDFAEHLKKHLSDNMIDAKLVD